MYYFKGYIPTSPLIRTTTTFTKLICSIAAIINILHALFKMCNGTIKTNMQQSKAEINWKLARGANHNHFILALDLITEILISLAAVGGFWTETCSCCSSSSSRSILSSALSPEQLCVSTSLTKQASPLWRHIYLFLETSKGLYKTVLSNVFLFPPKQSQSFQVLSVLTSQAKHVQQLTTYSVK